MGDVVRLDDHRHEPDTARHPAQYRAVPPVEDRLPLSELIEQARRTCARAQWLQREAQLLTAEAHYLLQMQSQQARARARLSRPRRPPAG